jgi:predicted SnoaL-like aldol condensation-catalyzing enzyme
MAKSKKNKKASARPGNARTAPRRARPATRARRATSAERAKPAPKPRGKQAGRRSVVPRQAKRGARAPDVASPDTDTLAVEQRRLDRNKKIVLASYYHLIGQKDFDAARRYMGETYTQHNPTAADGPEGIRAWIAEFKAAFPQHRYEIKHVIAEGEFVALHLHGMGGPSPNGEAVVDLFRVVDDRVVEHWDVIQPIPAGAENANSMF